MGTTTMENMCTNLISFAMFQIGMCHTYKLNKNYLIKIPTQNMS